MHDFGKIIYLDVGKTGSSYVSRFLRHNLLLDEKAFSKHARLGDDYRPKDFYFISTRDPLRQYISLFKYGLDGKGHVYGAFKRVGLGHLYEKHSVPAFERWLEFMLRPSRAKVLREDYYKTQPQLYGFQTFRFLALSLQHPIKKLGVKHTKSSLVSLYNKNKVHSLVVRTETLNEDLEKLLESPVGKYFRSSTEVRGYLASAGKLNQSQTNSDIPVKSISPALIELVKAREWFLYENICGK